MKEDIELKWAENIEKAKNLYSQRNKSQMYIAGLALEVCEITRGGPHIEGKYTIARFAEEIGMSPRNLSNWIAVRKLVYDRIDDKKKEECSYTQLATVALKVKANSPIDFVKEKFEEVVHSNSIQQKIRRYLNDLRSCAWNFENKNAAEKIDRETAEEILFYIKVIQRSIKKNDGSIKPCFHGVASRSNIKNLRASHSIDIAGNSKVEDRGLIVKLSVKDKEIAKYMKKNKRFFTPTELGMKLGSHNANSASAWSCRTLNKLYSLDLVERNKHGHYRWKE